MEARILFPEEYPKLEGTELENVWPVLPEGSKVIVIEKEGKIIAAWSVIPLVHVEGLWIDPDHKGLAVARGLINKMRSTAREMGAKAVLTSAVDDKIERLILRLGGVNLPGKHFALNIEGEL